MKCEMKCHLVNLSSQVLVLCCWGCFFLNFLVICVSCFFVRGIGGGEVEDERRGEEGWIWRAG